MSEVVEGRNAVLETLRWGAGVREVMISRGAKPHRSLEEIERLAGAAGIAVRRVSREELDRISARGAHQGVVAIGEPFGYATLEDVVARAGDRDRSLVLVLDHVTDPGNLGAVIRSAEALGADGVVIPKARAATVGAVALKTSAGAASHLPVARVANVARAVEELKSHGFWAAGASESAGQPVWDARLDGRIALVLGAEGAGLSRVVEGACDFLVSVPLTGRTASLNVAQAATVLAYEWSRREGAGE